MDNKGIDKYDLSAYCAVLAHQFEWARALNSQARQASAERAWSSISRFYSTDALPWRLYKGKPGKKGLTRFKKHQTQGSVEYKTTGWKLSSDRRIITFTDGFQAGAFKMWGTRDLHFYQLKLLKRVRVVRRADGYYVQFCLDVERIEKREPTGKTIGLDVGLNHLYTDSDGQTIENPRHLRKSEKALKRLGRRLSRTQKNSKNRSKARNRLSRKHLQVSRQRKEQCPRSWQGASSSLTTWLPMRTCRCGTWSQIENWPRRFLMLHGRRSANGWNILAGYTG